MENSKEALDLTYGSSGEKVIVTKSFLMSIKDVLEQKASVLTPNRLREKMGHAVDDSLRFQGEENEYEKTKSLMQDVLINPTVLTYIVKELK